MKQHAKKALNAVYSTANRIGAVVIEVEKEMAVAYHRALQTLLRTILWLLSLPLNIISCLVLFTLMASFNAVAASARHEVVVN